MYKIIQVNKCSVEDCDKNSVSYYGNKDYLYCRTHNNKYRSYMATMQLRSKYLCINGDCTNKVSRNSDGSYSKYCYNYEMICCYNSISSNYKFYKCSDIRYLSCMYEGCLHRPYKTVYDEQYKGNYCKEHYNYIEGLIYIPPHYLRDLPADDSWIEYGLNYICNTVQL